MVQKPIRSSKRTKKKLTATEDQVQQAVVEYFNRFKVPGVELVSINNNPMRRYLSRFHSMGGRKGVSDLEFIRRVSYDVSGSYVVASEVFWLEVKTETGRAQPEQIDFQNAMIDNAGCYAAVGKGVLVCIKIMKAWGLVR